VSATFGMAEGFPVEQGIIHNLQPDIKGIGRNQYGQQKIPCVFKSIDSLGQSLQHILTSND
jgi:hypothetical protein